MNAAKTFFSAQFTRYSPEATESLVRIAVALARIDSSDILPVAEGELRASAKAETVHYSTLIEGNELPLVEAQRAARGELEPDEQAKIELINYVDALELLDRRAEADDLKITPSFLLEIHKTTTRGLGSEESDHFKPHHEGAWRDGYAVVRDRISGKVFHEACPPEEVEGRIESMCDWIENVESRLTEYPPSVIAGVVHYGITDIHPFADGNGRVARLVTVALLMRHGLIARRLFSFERHYAENREAYYAALRSVRRNTLNMNEWLAYFLGGLAGEYERVADKIAELEGLGLRTGQSFQLNAAQEKALTQLGLTGMNEFRRVDYQRITGVGHSQAHRDLTSLREAGLIVVRGSGPASRYRLPRADWEAKPGRKRTWTDERIASELAEFCRGRNTWPSVQEFRDAGRGDLYSAVTRYGGRARWAAELGLSRRDRA